MWSLTPSNIGCCIVFAGSCCLRGILFVFTSIFISNLGLISFVYKWSTYDSWTEWGSASYRTSRACYIWNCLFAPYAIVLLLRTRDVETELQESETFLAPWVASRDFCLQGHLHIHYGVWIHVRVPCFNLYWLCQAVHQIRARSGKSCDNIMDHCDCPIPGMILVPDLSIVFTFG